MRNKIRFVQLESSAFLTDPDFMRMNCEQRGVYCSLILLLYCNNGELQLDSTANGLPCSKNIADLCNDWEIESKLDSVLSKFDFKDGVLTHKRVTEELGRAAAFSESKRQAGLMGAKKRWHSHNTDDSTANGTANGTAIAKVSKGKVSKVKKSKILPKNKVFIPPTMEEVKQYIQENPELANVDARTFFKGFNDSGWIDTQGKPVRNWKLKLRTWSKIANERTATTTGQRQAPGQKTGNTPNSREFGHLESEYGKTVEV